MLQGSTTRCWVVWGQDFLLQIVVPLQIHLLVRIFVPPPVIQYQAIAPPFWARFHQLVRSSLLLASLEALGLELLMPLVQLVGTLGLVCWTIP